MTNDARQLTLTDTSSGDARRGAQAAQDRPFALEVRRVDIVRTLSP
jgi:hypothetical protein